MVLTRSYENQKNLLLGEVLEEVVSFKYQGLFIDKHLNFDLHIKHVGKKINKIQLNAVPNKKFFLENFYKCIIVMPNQ